MRGVAVFAWEEKRGAVAVDGNFWVPSVGAAAVCVWD